MVGLVSICNHKHSCSYLCAGISDIGIMNLETTIKFVRAAMHNAKDHWGGGAKFDHVEAVANMMRPAYPDEFRIVAYLHDIVEDTDFNFGDLEALGFSDDVVAAVDYLTRQEGQTYEQYIKRMMEGESGMEGYDPIDDLALTIKISDLKHNMWPGPRWDSIPKGKRERFKRRHNNALFLLKLRRSALIAAKLKLRAEIMLEIDEEIDNDGAFTT